MKWQYVFFSGVLFWLLATSSGRLFSETLKKQIKVEILVEHDGWRIESVPIKTHHDRTSPGQWFTGTLDKIRRLRLEYGREFIIYGMTGWSFRLSVSQKGEVTAKKIDSGNHLADRVHVKLINNIFCVFLPKVHEIHFDIPWKYHAWWIKDTPEFFRGYRRTGAWKMLLPEGQWVLEGDAGWGVSFQVSKKGLKIIDCDSGPYGFKKDSIKTQGFSLSLPNSLIDVPFENPPLIPKLRLMGDARTPPKVSKSVQSSAIYTFIKDNRKYFKQGELIEFSIVIKNQDVLKDPSLLLELKEGSFGLNLFSQPLRELSSESHTFNYRLRTQRLKPGNYSLIASVPDKMQSAIDFVILNPLPDTHFKVLVYGGYEKSEILDRFSKGGINLLIHNGLGPYAPRSRLTDEGQLEIYRKNFLDPLAPPIETLIPSPWFRSYLENLERLGIELLAQYGSAFNFFHYGTCFMDPAIYKSICRGTMAMAQVGREFPNLVAFNLGDESGTHRGLEHSEGCAYCRAIFENRYGFQTPKGPRDGKKRWIQWMDFKQEMLPTLMRYVSQRVKQVANVLISAQNGGANYWPQDGGYPPKGMREFDVSAGHHYYAWAYGSVQTLWTILHDELIETLPRKIPYWPFILPHTGFEGTKHEIYACIMRECEGVGYFTDPEEAFRGQWEKLVQELHPQLHRFGDLFLALDRNRNDEVAIFYSYRQHIMDCYQDKGNWLRPVRRYLDRVSMALYACLRGHIPSSFISEEAIVDGTLFNRSVLLIVALTEMEPKVLDKINEFIERGGVVFTDSETKVAIRGARKLNISFREFYDRWFRVRKFRNAKPPYNDDEVTIPLAEKLTKVLKPFANVPADADSPHLIITEQVHGEGRYLFLLNDRFAGMHNVKGRKVALFKGLPAKVTLSNFSGFIYELFSGRRLEPKMEGGNAVLHFYFYPGEMKILCWMPEDINRLAVSYHLTTSELHLNVKVLDETGSILSIALPLEITITDPKGAERVHVFRALEKGICALDLPLAINDDPGIWKINVKELVSGKTENLVFELPGKNLKKESSSLVEKLGSVVVYDADPIRKFLAEKENVAIVIGEVKYESFAQKLARALQVHRGIKAEVIFDTEIRRNQFPKFYGYGTARSDWGVKIASPDIQIDRDLILIGSPLNNQLLEDLYFNTELPSRLVTPDFPGKGRGILQYVWQPFSDEDHDAILISGMDDEGLARAIEALIDMA
jgi:hypothetical protein